MGDSVEVAVRASARVGEGATWDSASSTLLWIDVLNSEVHRHDPARGSDAVLTVPQHVGAAKPRAGGGLVLNLRDGVALADRDGDYTWLVYWARDGVRGNDAGVDPAGRLWAGTMRYDEAPGGGWLAVVEGDGAARVAVPEVTISNGVAWDPDAALMYYVDSSTRRVDVFDYDRGSGEISARRPLCEVTGTAGVPDGICVDADGCVWVALHGGGAVRRYTPGGRVDREIAVPVPQPTSCCFGGPDLTDLYVTTAREGLSDAQLAGHELSGSVLVVPGAGQGQRTPAFTG